MKLDELVTYHFSTLFEEELLQEIIQNGSLKQVEPDKIILEIRRGIKYIPLIFSGVIKVMRRDGEGNGIFLHYLTAGETSAISVSYAQHGIRSDIRLKAENDVVYVAIPAKTISSWSERFQSWNKYLAKLNQAQVSSLIEKISGLVFTDLEHRLRLYLINTAKVFNTDIIHRKHQEIARDLTASREAVSRLLKKMEKEKVLILGRNKITMLGE